MKRLLTGMVVIAFAMGGAQAADLLETVDPVIVEEELFDWTGFYVGAQAGVVWGTVRVDDYFCIAVGECGSNPDNRYFAEYDIEGWKGGVHVGYNHQFGMFVLGAESDINFSNASGDGPFEFFDADEDEIFEGRPGETSSFAMLWEGSTRLKAGVAFDRWMPYVTGGIAYGQADVDNHRIFGEEESEEDPLRELDFSHSINLIGYTVGAGAAYAVTDNVIVRGEARFTQYGEVVSGDQIPGDGETIQVSGPSTFSLEGGVSFKF